MPTVQLRYGHAQIPFEYDENQFQILGEKTESRALSDVEIGERLDNPVDSAPLEEIIQPNETVLLVVPDATREAAAGQIVNLLVRRLIANGTNPGDIRIIFATGIHRPVTEEEKREILTTFIAQRIKILEHDAKDLMSHLRLGETARGISIELNRALVEHDHVILVGGITFHYFAGFSGGRKMICPGLGSSRTISETHKLAFDFERKTRGAGVDLAKLSGNPVHEEFAEIVRKINPSFSTNSIVNDRGELTELFAGNWQTAHERACEFYEKTHLVQISEKRETVIVSAGGSPLDINLIQAHKALEMAARACTNGGTIILLAECGDGLGRKDFLKWFESETSNALAEKLCSSYQVNGQTAWSLMTKAERFNIRIITAIPERETNLMRLKKFGSLNEALAGIDKNSKGYILPFGGKFLIKN